MKEIEERVEVLTVRQAGDRLDVYVAGNSDLSRARVQALVADGRVLVDGQVLRKADRLEVGQKIEVRIPPPEKLEAQQQLEHLLVCQTSQLDLRRPRHGQYITEISAPRTDRTLSRARR